MSFIPSSDLLILIGVNVLFITDITLYFHYDARSEYLATLDICSSEDCRREGFISA